MRRPNILLVVLDCVRQDYFPAPVLSSEARSFLTDLRAESCDYSNCHSVAPWTLPAHASLFTGLLPWQLNVHMHGALSLPPDCPTLAARLGRAGYQTWSLSANDLVGDSTGLTAGFDRAYWGLWWERYLPAWSSIVQPAPVNGSTNPLPRWPTHERLRWAAELMPLTHRFPQSLNFVNRVLRTGLRPATDESYRTSPWIEHSLESLLARRERAQPVFCFVNLLDAHEPYLEDQGGPESRRTTPRNGSGLRMDATGLLLGSWAPTNDQLGEIRRRYSAAVSRAVLRLQQVIRAFQEASLWDDTVLFVTSDHGQMLGEHGALFHHLYPWEEVLRIPLWVRSPQSDCLRGTVTVPVSQANVFSSILTVAGTQGAGTADGLPAPSSARTERVERSTFSLVDGLHPGAIVARLGSKAVRAKWDRPALVGYRDQTKAILELTNGSALVYNLEADPQEEHPSPGASSGPTSDLIAELRQIASASLSSGHQVPNPEVEARLKGWGYL